jgi:hypothetical protein
LEDGSNQDSENPQEPSDETKSKGKKSCTKTATGSIEKKLWNIAKKYKTLLDKGSVPQISESEEDRNEISDAYKDLTTKRHRQLDARVYGSLTKMQRTRDTKIALEGTTEHDRLRMLAWEVKIRTQPVMFILGDSTIEMDIFGMHDGNGVRVIDGEVEELTVEDIILDSKDIAIMDDLPIRKLTAEEKELLKEKFKKKYVGKTYKITEFEKSLDSISADLLSLLVREREIVVLKREQGVIEILPFSYCEENIDASCLISQSIVLAPGKEEKKVRLL